MTLKSLFEIGVREEIFQRLDQLSTESTAKWGKMNVSQMFAHCSEVLKLAVSTKNNKRTWLGFLIGGFFKKQLYNEKPFAQGLPTAPNFKMVTQKDFEEEKGKLISLIKRLTEIGIKGMEGKVHPIFGNLTPEQWGLSQWKHLNHHFEQFGV